MFHSDQGDHHVQVCRPQHEGAEEVEAGPILSNFQYCTLHAPKEISNLLNLPECCDNDDPFNQLLNNGTIYNDLEVCVRKQFVALFLEHGSLFFFMVKTVKRGSYRTMKQITFFGCSTSLQVSFPLHTCLI